MFTVNSSKGFQELEIRRILVSVYYSVFCEGVFCLCLTLHISCYYSTQFKWFEFLFLFTSELRDWGYVIIFINII